MLMDSFEVENFRSLKHLKLEKLARVNLLVGKNNSGKTSVLEALYALTRMEMPDWFDLIEENRGIEEEDRDFKSLFHGFDASKTVQIKAIYQKIGRGPKKFQASFSLVTDSAARTRKKEKRGLFVSVLIGTKNPLHRLILTRNGEDEMEYRTDSEAAKKFADGDLPENIAPRHTGEFLSTVINLDVLSDQLSDLSLNKRDGAVLAIMQRIDARIVSISLSSKGHIQFDLGEEFGMLSRINSMGEGIQRLLCIVAAIATNPGGTLLIDEIDNGLHYSALRILWKGILQAAREYDVQIVATTHSAEALRHLTWVLDEEENASYQIGRAHV